MHNFKTAEEKATEWGVSARYVQLLCRQKKVNGAIKHAGVWFIPDTAVNPVKRGGSNEQHFRFSGTKKKIFEKAVSLFAQSSYDFVTIKDIADEVGIRQSAVYNHFKSKQEILDNIYDFYCHYFTIDRPVLEDVEHILRNGTLLDIMNCVTYQFDEEYRELMINASKIIFHRNFMDERAREISKKYTVQEGIKFVEDVFQRAIDIGRLEPFDVHPIAVFCNSIRTFIFHNWIIEPTAESSKKWLADEQTLFRCATKLLKDLKPSN